MHQQCLQENSHHKDRVADNSKASFKMNRLESLSPEVRFAADTAKMIENNKEVVRSAYCSTLTAGPVTLRGSRQEVRKLNNGEVPTVLLMSRRG